MSEELSEEPSEQIKLENHIATLLPVQRQTIAMAQLAGCWFKPHSGERHVGYVSRKWRSNYVSTVDYMAYLPDGTWLGKFEDVYAAAAACLDELNGHNKPTKLNPDLFRLAPENEQP